MKGIFITAEGGEGAGKTTVLERIYDHLAKEGYDVLLTREPGGIPIAEEIRRVILHVNHEEMEMRTEALLYAAARRQHLIEKVIPALQAGKIVLCDRFIDSSLAYQGYARGIGIEEVYSINEFAIQGNMPSLTLFFDIPPEKGLARINANQNREVNRLDLETIDFHQKVYECYHLLLEKYPERMKSIAADGSLPQVTEDALSHIYSHLQLRRYKK